jgi:hypothetical protein
MDLAPAHGDCRSKFRSATILAMKPYIAALTATIVLVFVGTAAAKDPELLSLDLEHFRDTATVNESPLGSAAISTQNGFAKHAGPMHMVWSDEYLRSTVDQKTGEKSFQVYAWIIYSGNWRSYETATYQTPDGPKSVPAAKLGKEVANCAVGECTYTERVAFSVDEKLLRRLAAEYAPGKALLWNYKLTAKTGPDFASGLSNAEIAGLLAKVDEYSGALPAVRTKTAVATLKLDLGIAGLAVAATADQTNRAGILITGVERGSVAQKSGIIVGDIIFEFDGHPIKALTELQAAVAACAANSAVAIKLYRGTNPTTTSAQF